jgi:hypothetical protein
MKQKLIVSYKTIKSLFCLKYTVPKALDDFIVNNEKHSLLTMKSSIAFGTVFSVHGIFLERLNGL